MTEYLEVRQNGQITLPASVCSQANLAEGAVLEVLVDTDGSIRLVPISAEAQALIEQAQLEDVGWVLRQKTKY